MPKLDESEIKKALLATSEARREYANLQQKFLSERSRILAKQAKEGALKKLQESFLSNKSIDYVAEFDKILARNQTEINRLLEEQKAEVVKHSAAAERILRHGIDSWRQTIEHL
jgi:hypothetical protein